MAADAVLRALRHVWLILKSEDIPAAVVGGIAMAAWKHVRATRDVDLLIGLGEADTEPLLQTLRAAGIHPKSDRGTISLGDINLLQLVYQPEETFLDIQIDLLLGGLPYHEQALGRRLPTRLPEMDLEIDVLACEDLILYKLLAGRIIDRADAAFLLRANRNSLDFDYLRQWAKTLEVSPALSEIGNEAFPGEKGPLEAR